MDNQDYVRIYRTTEKLLPNWIPHEYMLKGNNGKSALPTEGIPVGSVAYKEDMTEMYMFNGTEWKVMGGEDA